MITRVNSQIFLTSLYTGGCLLSRETAVKDVKSCVRFCSVGILVGFILDFDWSIKNDQSKFTFVE